MLQAIRNQASSWVVRIFLLLLVLSFAVWGVGDMFLGSPGGNVAAEVDGEPVTLIEVDREFTNSLRQLQQQYGTAIDREGPLGVQLLNDALARSVARKLVDVHARDLNLGTDDQTVAEEVRNFPAFQSGGAFSRANFDFALQNLGLTEEMFLAQMRNDITRNRVLDTLQNAVLVPDQLGEILERYRNETRNVTVLEVPFDSIDVDDPDDTTLQSYLDDNQEDYNAPEYRSGLMLVLSPEDIAKDIDVDEQELRNLYEDRIDQFTTPARRNVVQLLAPSRDAIDEARQMAVEGADFGTVAANIGDGGITTSTFDELAPGDLPAVLDEAIWQTEPGAVSEPVESDFGWHIFDITDETPAVVQPFEDVRDILQSEIALERAIDQLPDLAAAVDDEIAAGNSLEDAAQALALSIVEIDGVDQAGLNEIGERSLPPSVQPEMLASFFGEQSNQVSLLEETADGAYYIYRVDRTDEPRPYTLGDIRNRLVEDWKHEQRRDNAQSKAGQLRNRASEGATLSGLSSSDLSLQLRQVEDVERFGGAAGAELSSQAVEIIFQTENGAIAEDVVFLSNAAAVIRVDAINEPEVDELAPVVLEQLQNEMAGDFLAQYEQALRRRYPVNINQAGLAVILQPSVQ